MRKSDIWMSVWSLLAVLCFSSMIFIKDDLCIILGMFCLVFAYLEAILDKLGDDDK